MKKTFNVLFVLFLFCSVSYANDLSLSITKTDYNHEAMQDTIGVSIEHSFDNGVYFDLSYMGEGELRYGGQETALIEIVSGSLGFFISVKDVRLFAQLGYYYPIVELLGSLEESSIYRHNNQLHGVESRIFENYDYELNPNIGGEFGFRFFKELDSVSLLAGASYRVLSFRETTIGYNGDAIPDHGTWRTKNDVDFGGYLIEFGFNYSF